MKKKVSILFTTAATAVILVLAGSSLTKTSDSDSHVTYISATYARLYVSLEKMANSNYTDAIVEGVVVDARSGIHKVSDPSGYGIIYTDYSFEVKLVLKGSLKPSDTILIRLTGGTVNGRTTVMREDPLLKVGETLILFLHQWESGKYFIEGGPQGRFIVQDGRVYSLGEIHKPAEVYAINDIKAYGQSEEQFINRIKSIMHEAHP